MNLPITDGIDRRIQTHVSTLPIRSAKLASQPRHLSLTEPFSLPETLEHGESRTKKMSIHLIMRMMIMVGTQSNSSPPLYFSREAIQEVLFVVALLTNKYRLCVTERTDLHVHVGNGEKGFTAETIQNLAATYWTFEAQIEQIHPPWMIDNVIALSFNRASTLAT
jgi:hypothetical protein